jgi:hypothetical protein
MQAYALALIAVLVIIVLWFHQKGRDSFVSQRAREVTSRAREIFTQKGDVRYSDYKQLARDAEPVLYSDVRELWRSNNLTPEAVQARLGPTA